MFDDQVTKFGEGVHRMSLDPMRLGTQGAAHVAKDTGTGGKGSAAHTPAEEFRTISEGAENALKSERKDSGEGWTNFLASLADVADVVGDAVSWVAQNVVKPIATALQMFPATAAYAPLITTGAEIAIAIEAALDKLIPDGDEVKKLASEAGAATAGAAAKVEQAAQKSADPAQATGQIAANTGFSDALQALLVSGDIESIIMMVMSERADRLTEGVQSKFTAMDANNKKLKALNDQAAVLNGKVAKDAKDQASAESLGKVNAEITQLSNTMQKEQIELNSLMSKLTQTYEALSNLMKKLADTQSSLVRNI
jgi:flagellar biosynthesis chaperone FliJ